MITTYAELKTAINDWTDDGTEASDFADTYIDLAEAHFSKKLRTREMEASATISLDSSGEGDLPADFLELRRLKSNTSPECNISYVTPEVLRDMYYTTESGYPTHYTIEGSKIRVRDTASDVTAYYYQSIPALSDSQTTNWLLTRSPMLYLVTCEAEHAWRTKDYEGHARSEQRRDMLIEEILSEDKAARWPNASARVLGVTP